MNKLKVFSVVGLIGLFSAANVGATQVKVTITNNSQPGGLAITPV